MSFSRSKCGRFGEFHCKPLRKPLGCASKLPKHNQFSVPPVMEANSAGNKSISQSQPTSDSSLKKETNQTLENSPRPHSGGYPKKNLRISKYKELVKTNPSENSEAIKSTTVVEELSSKMEEPFQSKIPTIKRRIQIEDDEKTGSVSETQEECSTSTAKSNSGIPVRTKHDSAAKVESRNSTPRSHKQLPSLIHSNIPKRITSPKVNFSPFSEAKPQQAAYPCKRTLETIFQLKKRRYDQLRKEHLDRQKPLIETYQSLLQLKTELEGTGKKILLENIKVIECTGAKNELNRVGAGELATSIDVDPELVEKMKAEVEQIPQCFLKIANELSQKRTNVIEMLEKFSLNELDVEDVNNQIDEYKDDTETLNITLNKTVMEQNSNIKNIINQWQVLYKSSLPEGVKNHEALQYQLAEQISKTIVLESQLQEERRQKEESLDLASKKRTELEAKIVTLDQEVQTSKALISEYKELSVSNDHKTKTAKKAIVDFEKKIKDWETKYNDITIKYKTNLDQQKVMEIKWSKEKEEFVSKSKHDRQMLEKLTKDRSFFETRAKILEEQVEEQDKKYHEMELQYKNTIDHTKEIALEDRTEKESMKIQYENMKDKLVEMEIRNKQAVDLVSTRNMFEPNETDGLRTEKEAQLYTELMANRVTLKALQEQIQEYNKEKLRFIELIEVLHNDPNRETTLYMTNVAENIQKLTIYEAKMNEYEKLIENQKIEIANLKTHVEASEQQATAVNYENVIGGNDSDLKLVVHQGKIKLDQSLKKNLEYEHRIIRYEHEINKQCKQIRDVENLLKLREGLITVIKVKKDELQMENDSLSKYANEVREQLMQCKEDLGSKTESISELSTHLEKKSQLCYHLQKKIDELQKSLSTNNEKRFRLQESISVMEKQLQSAHILNDDQELHLRYNADSNNLHEIKSTQDIEVYYESLTPYSANKSFNVHSKALSHYKANKSVNNVNQNNLTNLKAEVNISERMKKWELTYKSIGKLQSTWKHIDQYLSMITQDVKENIPYHTNPIFLDKYNFGKPNCTAQYTRNVIDRKHASVPNLQQNLISQKLSALQNQVSDFVHPTKKKLSYDQLYEKHTNKNLSKSPHNKFHITNPKTFNCGELQMPCHSRSILCETNSISISQDMLASSLNKISDRLSSSIKLISKNFLNSEGFNSVL